MTLLIVEFELLYYFLLKRCILHKTFSLVNILVRYYSFFHYCALAVVVFKTFLNLLDLKYTFGIVYE
jgi:hypothetical protein